MRNVRLHDSDPPGKLRIESEVTPHAGDRRVVELEADDRCARQARESHRVIAVVSSDIEATEAGPGKSPDVSSDLQLGCPQIGVQRRPRIDLESQPASEPDRNAPADAGTEGRRAYGPADQAATAAGRAVTDCREPALGRRDPSRPRARYGVSCFLAARSVSVSSSAR